MFAIALWDRARERLVLARDRIGKKPLHYVTLPGRRPRVRVRAEGAVPAPRPPARARPGRARRLPRPPVRPRRGARRRRDPTARAGTRPHLGGRAASQRAVSGSCSPAPRDLGEDEWLELVRETVTAAVRRRLVSDVPLGALLSGGIDSTIVVGLMAQASSEPVKTFTVGVDDPRYDERAHARLAASAFGTTHEELVVEPIPSSSSRGSRPSSTSRSATRRSCRRSSSPRSLAGT